ncbi:MAG: pyridoxamine 5'-phosphate oxidase family protein [candidate division Zixibacteria bacterium]|nr:pyridoxamine 5'-phosphate oxidase family protein [candidate division Zixibacteria bacterium]
MRKDLKELFTTQPLAVLSTQNEGQPYASLVAFATSEDLKQLFFATTRATRKYGNLSSDPRVAMLVDSRSNEVSDFRWAMAVTATGKVEEVEGQEKERVLQIYLAKHPHLDDFVSSPSCALLKIRVERYYVATRFQNVTEVHVKE